MYSEQLFLGSSNTRGCSPPPTNNFTIKCVLCNLLVASTDDEYVDHLLEKHEENEALFVLESINHGDLPSDTRRFGESYSNINTEEGMIIDQKNQNDSNI